MRDSLHIGQLPGRKSICLYETVGGQYNGGATIKVLAFFRNVKDAKRTLALLDKLAKIEPGDDWHGWSFPK